MSKSQRIICIPFSIMDSGLFIYHLAVWPYFSFLLDQLIGALEYTDSIYAAGQDPVTNECPGYDTKQSDGKAPIMLDFGEMRAIHLLLSLPTLRLPGAVSPDRVQSMGQIELNGVLILKWITWTRTVWLNWITWNRNDLTIKRCTYAELNCLK